MRFVVMLAESDPEAWLTATEEETERVFAQHRAFDAAVAERGTLESGAALAPGQQTLRGGGADRVFSDGPFAETAEQVTGVYVVDLPSREVAHELVRLLPESYVITVAEVAVLEDY